MPNENDDERKAGTDLVPVGPITFVGMDLASAALRKTGADDTSLAEIRKIRRGKFFLSRSVQTMHGSVRRPIFQHYFHGVIVGEMKPSADNGLDDGAWCFGAHNDFDPIPESTSPDDWPEYTRTPTGFVRVDGQRKLKAPFDPLEKLLEWNMKQLRLK